MTTASRNTRSSLSESGTSQTGGTGIVNSTVRAAENGRVETSARRLIEEIEPDGTTTRRTLDTSSAARSAGTVSGTIREGKEGTTSVMEVSVSRGGRQTELSEVDLLRQSGETRFRTLVWTETAREGGDSFTGTITTDAENRTRRQGDVTSTSGGTRVEGQRIESYREGSAPQSQVSERVGTSGTEFTVEGTVYADQNIVREEGEWTRRTFYRLKTDASTDSSTYQGVDVNYTWDTSSETSELDEVYEKKSAGTYLFVQDLTGQGKDIDEVSEGNASTRSRAQGLGTEETERGTRDGDVATHETGKRTTQDKSQSDDDNSSSTTVVKWENKWGTAGVSEYQESGTHTQTATSAGSEPGDNQSLKITRELEGSGTATIEDVANDYHERKEVLEVKWDANATYNASHKLGADGVSAVGGTVTASGTNNRTSTVTIKRKSTTEGDVYLRTSKTEGTQVSSQHQQEEDNFSYEDTPYGRKLEGSGSVRQVDVFSDGGEYKDRRDFFNGDYDVYKASGGNFYRHETNSTISFGDTVWQTYTSSFTQGNGSKINWIVEVDENYWYRSGQLTWGLGHGGHGVENPTSITGVRSWGHGVIDGVPFDGSDSTFTKVDGFASPKTDGPGGPVNPGSFSVMTDAEFKKYVDSMPDDLAGFNDALNAMSDAARAAFEARAAALDKNQSGADEYGQGFWGALGSELGQTGKGIVWDGPKEIVSGLIDVVTTNPLTTIQNVGNAIWNYDQTANAIYNDILDKAQSSNGRGRLAFDVASSFLGAATAKYASKIAKAGKVADAVDDVGDAARAAGVVTPQPVVTKIGQLADDVSEEGGLNLFKWGKPQTGAVTGWRMGDRMLALPDQGSARLNWQQNASALRAEMRSGQPIFDSYIDPLTGKQIPTDGFLNAERNLLESHGWRFDPTTGAYHPPGY